MHVRRTRKPLIVIMGQFPCVLARVQRPQRKGATGKGSGGKAKKTQLKFTINCSTPVEDEIMDAGAFVSCVTWDVHSVSNSCCVILGL